MKNGVFLMQRFHIMNKFRLLGIPKSGRYVYEEDFGSIFSSIYLSGSGVSRCQSCAIGQQVLPPTTHIFLGSRSGAHPSSAQQGS